MTPSPPNIAGAGCLDWLASNEFSAGVRQPASRHVLIGVLNGEGIGPEVVQASLEVLQATATVHGFTLGLEYGGEIGRLAEKRGQPPLPADVVAFASRIFSRGGALLNGPGGGRYVYDLRAQFDLFCKLNPIVVPAEFAGAGRMRDGHTAEVDLLIVREGASGLYQGQAVSTHDPKGERRRDHTFGYSETEVRRVVTVAARLAQQRRNKLTVVYKEAGVPGISELWRDCAQDIAAAHAVGCEFLDIDYAGYRLLQQPRDFDVIVAPNLFGDILSDLGGVFLGSRALTFGGSFSAAGHAVYQTNHGAAYDLAGTDRANPLGQIYSAALMLRESFGLIDAAEAIHAAVRAVWRAGWRTADLPEGNHPIVGTRQLGQLVAEAVRAPAAA